MRHWLPHPAGEVYAAFLDPDVLPRWYGPDGLHPEPGSTHVEARAGGSWRLVLVDEHDQRVRVAVERTLRTLEPGRLIEADEGAPLAQTAPVQWRVELAADPADATAPRGTTIEVREGPLPAAAVALSATGWAQALTRLESVLGHRQP